MMRDNGYMRELGQFGIQRQLIPGTRREHFVTECGCGARLEKGGRSNMNPDKLKKMFAQAGWALDVGETPLCPSCRARERTMKTPPKTIKLADVTPELLSLVAQAKDAGQPDKIEMVKDPAKDDRPPEINPKLLRRVYALLDSEFDDKAHRYSAGWSDARIAKETGASADFIARIRRDAYGELAEDPELIDLRHRLSKLEAQIADVETVLLNSVEDILGKLQATQEDLKARIAKFDLRQRN